MDATSFGSGTEGNSPGLQARVDTLVAAALDNGGSDNITVLVLRCH